MPKQGMSISFRLHPSSDKEKQAIEIIKEKMAMGLEPRQIMTDALLRSAGFTPEMFRNSDERLTPALMESILMEFGHYLLNSIRDSGGVTTTNSQPANELEFDEDEDVEMLKNIAAGWATRNKK